MEHSGHLNLSTVIPPATELHPNLRSSEHVRPHLLVSVRNSQEARLARSSGVDWIDLKNPDSGALGAADEATAAAVAQELQQSDGFDEAASRLTSAAVGELRDWPTAAVESLARYFPLLKVGLSGLRDRQHWPEQVAEFANTVKLAGSRLVPVIYADYEVCNAPAPAQIVEVASRLDEQQSASGIGLQAASAAGHDPGRALAASGVDTQRYLLVDTFTKDGRRLLDWMQLAELQAIVEQVAASGRQTVVAGSLALQDLPQLMSLPVAAIAIRGAVCADDRRSGLCPAKLQQWVELFSAR